MTDKEKAYNAAVRVLAASDKTEAELKNRLTMKGFSDEDADYAVSRLIKEGYLNEKALAEKTVSRLFEAHYGRGYIMQYLLQKNFKKSSISAIIPVLDKLDFERSAKEYYTILQKAGKTKTQALSALYRRGFEI